MQNEINSFSYNILYGFEGSPYFINFREPSKDSLYLKDLKNKIIKIRASFGFYKTQKQLVIMSKLFAPLKIRNITLKNRIVMSPMCQYSATDGLVNDWHLVHYGTRAVGGCGTIIVEATAVSPEGRITYKDLGIWNDDQKKAFVKITNFLEKEGVVPGIQLAHAGRKASFDLPWLGEAQLHNSPNGWQTVSASAIAFHPKDMIPLELSKDNIKRVVSDFKQAAQRAVDAGFKILEIHAAHGYLIHQFLSPISNKRQDEYGGSFENRIRFLLEIVDELVTFSDSKHSLWVRISATDWVEGGWNEVEAVKLANILKNKGVDIMDISSGGNVSHAPIPVAPNYQVPFADKVKKESGISVGAVGLITTAQQANTLLDENKCDVIMLGRVLLRDPYFSINAAIELDDNKNTKPVDQYIRGY